VSRISPGGRTAPETRSFTYDYDAITDREG
jgi:hypothetical protein